MTYTTISREFNTELCELIEDSVEYIIGEYANNGEYISGETVYKMLECVAIAKQEQFKGNVI